MRAFPLTVAFLLIAVVALVAVGDIWAQAPAAPPAAADPGTSATAPAPLGSTRNGGSPGK